MKQPKLNLTSSRANDTLKQSLQSIVMYVCFLNRCRLGVSSSWSNALEVGYSTQYWCRWEVYIVEVSRKNSHSYENPASSNRMLHLQMVDVPLLMLDLPESTFQLDFLVCMENRTSLDMSGLFLRFLNHWFSGFFTHGQLSFWEKDWSPSSFM